jgi:RecA-family ATPase
MSDVADKPNEPLFTLEEIADFRRGFQAHIDYLDRLLGNAPPLPTLRVLNPADWEGRVAPSRLWVVPDYIPNRTVTLLYADGGTGKSYLKLQLAVARAIAREWIGLLPEPGRTLICSTEDDHDEVWRRIEGMLPFYGARMADLSDIRIVDLVGGCSLLGALANGQVVPTAMYEAISRLASAFKPGLICLDVLADMFGGNENDRSQVTQFVGLLKGLCREHDCAVLLLAQPSLSGLGTDRGTSGSTGWGNAGRSRLWFKRVQDTKGNEPNKNRRVLEGRKSNYSELGGAIELEWERGLFRPVVAVSGFDKLAANVKAEDEFLAKLKSFESQGRNVSHRKGPSYAPAAFSNGKGTIGNAAFAAAMDRLFEAGKIRVEESGAPSRRRSRIVANG